VTPSAAKTDTYVPREARQGPVFHPDWGTHAFAQYNGVTTGLDALLAMVLPEEGESPEAANKLAERRRAIEAKFSGPWAIDVGHTMLSWQVAMRVSAVEVYLQAALTFLAVYDEEFIRTRGSEQAWTYDDVRSASDNDEMLWTFCHRWARSFIGKGGPHRWGKALREAGLGTFDESDVTDLEAMWGYRHVRVHEGAYLTREFATRHPEVTAALLQEGLSPARVRGWSSSADKFVAAAEKGVAGRLRAKLGPALIAHREQREGDRQYAMWAERLMSALLERYPEEAPRWERVWIGGTSAARAMLYELTQRDAAAHDPSNDSRPSGDSTT
jgi:hypothetical protein